MRRVELLSDFNIEILQKIIKIKNKDLSIKLFNYSNIFFQLKNGLSSDINLILASPEGLFPTFCNLFKNKKINLKLLNKEIEFFTSSIIRKINKNNEFYVASFIKYQQSIFSNLFNYNNKNSHTYILNYINNKISEIFSKYNNIHIIDMNDLILQYNLEPIDRKYYIASKSYFSLNFYEYFSNFFLLLLKQKKQKIKLILLDLDDTLWGGTVSEIGWQKINLGGNNVSGELFKKFQESLLIIKNYGIPLGIVSKNNPKTALQAINRHPEMILRSKDFIISKINFNNKANNILEISSELNLTTDSFVFFDDSAFERKNVIQRIPGIIVPDLSGGPSTYSKKLEEIGIIIDKNSTKEDSERSDMYVKNLQRELIKKKNLNKNDWVKQLKIKIIFEKFKKVNEDRILQLFNKTNQMNLRTNRYNVISFNKFLKEKNTQFFSVKVSDKFGEYGLTALLNIKKKNNNLFIHDFVMSCRITGRGVEEEIMHFIKKKFSQNKAKIYFELKRTEKNDLMQNFLNTNKIFKKISKNLYQLN